MALDAQITIAEDEGFRRRLRQALIQEAIVIFTEAGTVTKHAERLALAKQILGGQADAHVTRLAYILPTIAAVEQAGREVDDATLKAALASILTPYTQVVG